MSQSLLHTNTNPAARRGASGAEGPASPWSGRTGRAGCARHDSRRCHGQTNGAASASPAAGRGSRRFPMAPAGNCGEWLANGCQVPRRWNTLSGKLGLSRSLPAEQDCSPQSPSRHFAPAAPARSDGARPLLVGQHDAANRHHCSEAISDTKPQYT